MPPESLPRAARGDGRPAPRDRGRSTRPHAAAKWMNLSRTRARYNHRRSPREKSRSASSGLRTTSIITPSGSCPWDSSCWRTDFSCSSVRDPVADATTIRRGRSRCGRLRRLLAGEPTSEAMAAIGRTLARMMASGSDDSPRQQDGRPYGGRPDGKLFTRSADTTRVPTSGDRNLCTGRRWRKPAIHVTIRGRIAQNGPARPNRPSALVSSFGR